MDLSALQELLQRIKVAVSDFHRRDDAALIIDAKARNLKEKSCCKNLEINSGSVWSSVLKISKEGKHRNTYARISKKAIAHNIKSVQATLANDCEIFAVVKANGYGHGAVEIAKIARDNGVKGFCVALLDEALELRDAGITEPIIILGIVDVQLVPIIAAQQFSVTVSSLEWMKRAEEKMISQQNRLKVHIALDTGMGRNGLRTSEWTDVERILNDSDIFEFEGIFTDFTTAAADDRTHYNEELKKFNELVRRLGNKPRLVRVPNSATVIEHEEVRMNSIHYGVALHGLSPTGNITKSEAFLQPAMELISELVHVKEIHLGDTISYGATYKATTSEWVGTIPIGYADGWRRNLQGQTVLVDGHRCELIGRICMDQCMIRLPKEYPVGTPVVLVGKSGEDEVTMDELAEYLGTVKDEIPCGLSLRVPRIYV